MDEPMEIKARGLKRTEKPGSESDNPVSRRPSRHSFALAACAAFGGNAGRMQMAANELIDQREYLRLWLERSRPAADATPTVQRLYEVVDWQVRTLERLPIEAKKISDARQAPYLTSPISSYDWR